MNTGTAIGTYIFGVVVLVIISVSMRRMIKGWRHRGERQQELIGTLPPLPALLGAASLGPMHGLYVGSTLAEIDTGAPNWMERIAVGDLGYRSKAALTKYPNGILMVRSGASTIWIPQESIAAVRTETALAGKVMPTRSRGNTQETGGVLAIRWRLPSGTVIDTGFRGDGRPDYRDWISS